MNGLRCCRRGWQPAVLVLSWCGVCSCIQLHAPQRRSLRRTYTLLGPIQPDCYYTICNIGHLLRTQNDLHAHQRFTTGLNHPSITLKCHRAPPYYRNCLKYSQLAMFNPKVGSFEVRPNSNTTKLTTQSTKTPKCHLHMVLVETGVDGHRPQSLI